jgi:hypothetical protein
MPAQVLGFALEQTGICPDDVCGLFYLCRFIVRRKQGLRGSFLFQVVY